jgi:hypothetical protein
MTRDYLDPKWLDVGHFKLDGQAPSLTSRIRDRLEELSGLSLRLVKNPSRGYAENYYIREGDGAGEPQAQYVMAIDTALPSLILGLSIEKGEESSRAPAGRRMDRSTWDWPRLSKLRDRALDTTVAKISRLEEDRPISFLMWTDREDEDEEWHYTFAQNEWFQRGVQRTGKDVVACISRIDEMRSRWADIWIGFELGQKEVANTSTDQAARLLHAFSPLRARLRAKIKSKR